MVPEPKYDHFYLHKDEAGNFYISVLPSMNTFWYYTGNYQIASFSAILFLSKYVPSSEILYVLVILLTNPKYLHFHSKPHSSSQCCHTP